jgi:pimeloyl-ACP methyl ester carboxylesterase
MHSIRVQHLALLLALTIIVGGCGKDDPVTPPDNNNVTIDEKIRPVVFVHDKLQAADAWVPYTQLFTLNGYAESMLHPTDFSDVAQITSDQVPVMAQQLQAKVDAVLAATKADRVDLVAHGYGARAVQHYLTKMNGTGKVAHVAFVGGVFDMSLTSGSTLTPTPVKYMTIRSNGKDATQTTPDDGQLAGADNRQIADLDHQQLLIAGDAYTAIHTFFSGAVPTVKKLPKVQILRTFYIKGRVISMFDNAPIANAMVSFWWIGSTQKGRQSNGTWRTVTADAQGYFSFVDTIRPISRIEVIVKSADHHESHYFKTEWRENVMCERYRLMPKSSGSSYLASVRSALNFDNVSTIAVIHSPYQAFNVSRDDVKMLVDTSETTERMVNLLNARTAPPTGGNNPFMMFVFDADRNQSDGQGPVNNPVLDAYGITSHDVYIDASRSALFSTVIANQKSVYFQNFRGGGTVNNASGLVFIRYDFYNDAL